MIDESGLSLNDTILFLFFQMSNGSTKQPQSICNGSVARFLPHPTECQNFIFCKNGIASIQQCPFYHHWDIVTESCKWKQFAVCNSKRN